MVSICQSQEVDLSLDITLSDDNDLQSFEIINTSC